MRARRLQRHMPQLMQEAGRRGRGGRRAPRERAASKEACRAPCLQSRMRRCTVQPMHYAAFLQHEQERGRGWAGAFHVTGLMEGPARVG